MPKIVHTADLHLDSAFSGRFGKDEAAELRGALRDAFSNIINLAEEADILLIAGDLFDGSEVTRNTINFLRRKFAEIKNVKVFISAGNHDPFMQGSVYESVNLGSNVHVFSTDGECVELRELNTRVYGISFGTSHITDTKILSAKDDDMINLLLIHGDCGKPESDYNPIPLETIAESKMNYAALGHVHQPSGVMCAGGVYWAYPGAPQGRGFDETSCGCVLAGEVDKDGVRLRSVRVSNRNFSELNIDISGAQDTNHVCEIIREQIKSDKDIYRINLIGESDSAFVLDIDFILCNVSQYAYHVEMLDKTTIKIDYNKIEDETSLRGRFVSDMKQKITEAADDNERKVLSTALKYGVEAIINAGKAAL